MTEHAEAEPPHDEPLARVLEALDAQDLEAAQETVAFVREDLEEAFRGRRLTPGSLLLERKRRLHQRLDDLERLLHARRLDEARTLTHELLSHGQELVEAARALPRRSRTSRPRGPSWAANVATVARKELVVQLQGTQGLVLFGLFLATFGLGLEAVLGAGLAGVEPSVALVWNYAHSLDFLAAPLAGILLGHGLINQERTSGTIHFLASKPVSRTGLVAGKWLGMAGALAAILFTSALIVGGVAYGVTRTLGDPGAVVGYPVATYLLALAFASIALALSALLDRGGAALISGIGLFLVLGPLWQNLFLTRSLQNAGAQATLASVLPYLSSPFTAWWNWTSELLGPESTVLGLPVGEPWHAALVEAVERGTLDALPFYATQPFYALVVGAWCVIGFAVALAAVRARDLA